MLLHFIDYLLNNVIVHALFKTLVHSLWQGIIWALIAAIVLFCTKNSQTATRYKLLTGVLLAFIITSMCTFCYETGFITIHQGTATSNSFLSLINNSASTNSEHHVNLIRKIILFFQSNENFIVFAWFVITILKCLRLITGLRNVHILKHSQVSDAGEYWNIRMKELSAKAGVTKPVKLLRSAIIRIPMVIGHLKPVILFPAVALTTLAPVEIEAILLHELAHVRRKDYLVNMLQHVTEILFFFNPAVLWISSLIKEERENCCDDIAVNQIKNKKQFIHALLSFQEHDMESNYAASFSANKNYLLNRIKRIITNNNKTLNNMEKIFLATGIMITGLIAVVFSQNKQSSLATASEITQPVKTFTSINKKDTLAPIIVDNNNSKTVINSSENGKQYRLVEVNGEVTELYVNELKIPQDKLPQYKDVINRLQQHLKADKEIEGLKAQKEYLQAQAKAMEEKELAMNDQAEAANMQQQALKNDSMYLQEHVLMMKEQAKQMEEQALKANADVIQQKALIMKEESEKNEKVTEQQSKELAEKAYVLSKQALIMKEQAQKQTEEMKLQQQRMIEQSQLMEEKAKLIKAEMEKQSEKLKQQDDELKQHLKENLKDSI